MRPLPFLAAAVLAHAAAPAAAAPSVPPERFVAPDATMVFSFPSLERTLEQAAGLFATAASFPGGAQLEEKREELEREFGFDLLDRSWLEEAGIDPRRAAAVSLAGVEDWDDDEDGDLVFVLPVASPARFEKSFARVARENGEVGPRTALPGTPKVFLHRAKVTGGDSLAYALAEGYAVMTIHPDAAKLVKAALAVPRTRHVGTSPAYRELQRAIGPGLGIVGFVPPGSPAAKDEPMLAGGYAMGGAGGADGVRVAMAFVLPKTSPLVAKPPADTAPLVGKLHAGSFLVARTGTNLTTELDPEALAKALGRKKALSPRARELLAGFVAALGSGLAVGVSAVEPPAGEAPPLSDAPFAWFRGELAVGVGDPAALRAVIRRWLRDTAGGAEVSEQGPWTFPFLGGEVGLSVEKRRLLAAFGPEGVLQALAARAGTERAPPTPASARALERGPAGLSLDVPKLVLALRSLPPRAFGAGAKGRRDHQQLQAILPIVSRFREVALWTELSGPVLRAELAIGVEPAQAEAAGADSAPEGDAGDWGIE